MKSTTEKLDANGAVASTGAGIFMPGPYVQNAGKLTEGQTLTIPQNRPMYLFLPDTDYSTAKERLVGRGPLSAKALKTAPQGAPDQGSPGTWVEISDKRSSKPGEREDLQITFIGKEAKNVRVEDIHLQVTGNIYFMAGRPA
jgi:hypothetical protein